MFPRPTRVSSHGAILTAVAAAIACLVTAHAAACPYSIRDSAFIGRGSSTPFLLVVLTRTDAPGRAQLAKSVEVATAAWLADSNVVARLVDVDGPRAKDLPDAVRARFATPDTTPAAVLISPSDRALDLDGLGPSASSERVVLESFGHAVASPVRRDLPQRLISSWCVVLFVAGTDDARNASARAAIDAAAKSIVGKSTELGKVIASAPTVLSVEAESREERTLLWSLGLDAPAGDDASERPARAIILAGRGETRGPLLEGEEISVAKVTEVLEMLGRSCSCTTSPTWLIGRGVPLVWKSSHEAAAREALGFDPQDPNVLRSIRGERRPEADALVGFDEFDIGYDEIAIEPIEAPLPSAEVTGEDTPPDAGPDTTDDDESGTGGTARPTGTAIQYDSDWTVELRKPLASDGSVSMILMAVVGAAAVLLLAAILGTVWMLTRAKPATKTNQSGEQPK